MTYDADWEGWDEEDWDGWVEDAPGVGGGKFYISPLKHGQHILDMTEETAFKGPWGIQQNLLDWLKLSRDERLEQIAREHYYSFYQKKRRGGLIAEGDPGYPHDLRQYFDTMSEEQRQEWKDDALKALDDGSFYARIRYLKEKHATDTYPFDVIFSAEVDPNAPGDWAKVPDYSDAGKRDFIYRAGNQLALLAGEGADWEIQNRSIQNTSIYTPKQKHYTDIAWRMMNEGTLFNHLWENRGLDWGWEHYGQEQTDAAKNWITPVGSDDYRRSASPVEKDSIYTSRHFDVLPTVTLNDRPTTGEEKDKDSRDPWHKYPVYGDVIEAFIRGDLANGLSSDPTKYTREAMLTFADEVRRGRIAPKTDFGHWLAREVRNWRINPLTIAQWSNWDASTQVEESPDLQNWMATDIGGHFTIKKHWTGPAVQAFLRPDTQDGLSRNIADFTQEAIDDLKNAIAAGAIGAMTDHGREVVKKINSKKISVPWLQEWASRSGTSPNSAQLKAPSDMVPTEGGMDSGDWEWEDDEFAPGEGMDPGTGMTPGEGMAPSSGMTGSGFLSGPQGGEQTFTPEAQTQALQTAVGEQTKTPPQQVSSEQSAGTGATTMAAGDGKHFGLKVGSMWTGPAADRFLRSDTGNGLTTDVNNYIQAALDDLVKGVDQGIIIPQSVESQNWVSGIRNKSITEQSIKAAGGLPTGSGSGGSGSGSGAGNAGEIEPAMIEALAKHMSEAAAGAIEMTKQTGFIMEPVFGTNGRWTYRFKLEDGQKVPYDQKKLNDATIAEQAAHSAYLQAQAAMMSGPQSELLRSQASLNAAEALVKRTQEAIERAKMTGTLIDPVTKESVQTLQAKLAQAEIQKIQADTAYQNNKARLEEAQITGNLYGRDTLEKQKTDAGIRQINEQIAQKWQEIRDAKQAGDLDRALKAEQFIQELELKKSELAQRESEFARTHAVQEAGVTGFYGDQATLARQQAVAQAAANPRNYLEASFLSGARGGLYGMTPTNYIPPAFGGEPYPAPEPPPEEPPITEPEQPPPAPPTPEPTPPGPEPTPPDQQPPPPIQTAGGPLSNLEGRTFFSSEDDDYTDSPDSNYFTVKNGYMHKVSRDQLGMMGIDPSTAEDVPFSVLSADQNKGYRDQDQRWKYFRRAGGQDPTIYQYDQGSLQRLRNQNDTFGNPINDLTEDQWYNWSPWEKRPNATTQASNMASGMESASQPPQQQTTTPESDMGASSSSTTGSDQDDDIYGLDSDTPTGGGYGGGEMYAQDMMYRPPTWEQGMPRPPMTTDPGRYTIGPREPEIRSNPHDEWRRKIVYYKKKGLQVPPELWAAEPPMQVVNPNKPLPPFGGSDVPVWHGPSPFPGNTGPMGPRSVYRPMGDYTGGMPNTSKNPAVLDAMGAPTKNRALMNPGQTHFSGDQQWRASQGMAPAQPYRSPDIPTKNPALMDQSQLMQSKNPAVRAQMGMESKATPPGQPSRNPANLPPGNTAATKNPALRYQMGAPTKRLGGWESSGVVPKFDPSQDVDAQGGGYYGRDGYYGVAAGGGFSPDRQSFALDPWGAPTYSNTSDYRSSPDEGLYDSEGNPIDPMALMESLPGWKRPLRPSAPEGPPPSSGGGYAGGDLGGVDLSSHMQPATGGGYGGGDAWDPYHPDTPVGVGAGTMSLLTGKAVPSYGKHNTQGGWLTRGTVQQMANPNRIKTADYMRLRPSEQAQTKAIMSLGGYSDEDFEDQLRKNLPKFGGSGGTVGATRSSTSTWK